MKNQKGVNLVGLSVAVIVIIAIAGTVLYNVRTNLGVQKLKAMQADIENLRGKVANYYLQYGALPTLNVYSGGVKQDTSVNNNALEGVITDAVSENLDTGKYYVIDLSAMENITLTYGKDYEKLKNETAENIQTLKDGTLTDIYIINSVSHNIFYVHGTTYEGKTYYTQYQDEEKNKVGKINFNIDIESKVGRDDEGNLTYTVCKGEKAPSNRKVFYKDSNNEQAIIPGGFTVSNNDGESTIENGLVIRDENENEWVWVPVSDTDINKMYVEDSTGWNLGNTAVNTKLRTRELTTQNTYKLGNRELLRQVPGNTSAYREPDVLSENDTDQQYRTQAGFGDLVDMATKLKDDYKDMIDSIRKNGGFYIGRFEIGKNTSDNNKPQVKSGKVMNDTNWYNIYAACKSFSNENTQSRMIWGCQWDQVCRFINEHGDKVNLDNSTTYGNFNNSVGEAAVNSGVGNFNNTTGRNEAWKTNNIYDFAGNCSEFTQEAYITGFRAVRGRTTKWRWIHVFSIFS